MRILTLSCIIMFCVWNLIYDPCKIKIPLQDNNYIHKQNMYMIISGAIWHLKWLTTQLFVQQLGHTGPLWGESIRDRWLTLTKDSNAESVSMSERHYEDDLLSDFFIPQQPSIRGLTYWGPDKMGDILQMTFSSRFSWTKNVWILIKISLKFVPNGPIGIMPALVQIMAWRLTGDKPLSEPMMTDVVNAYMHHSAIMS